MSDQFARMGIERRTRRSSRVAASILSVLPVGVFAGVLAFLGLDVLFQWVWVERRRLALPTSCSSLAILGIAGRSVSCRRSRPASWRHRRSSSARLRGSTWCGGA
ncbi:MAG: hypothetical protein U1E59_10490 [Amaricoccus sp.]